MRCLGLLGGEKLEITTTYAQRIADEVRHRFGYSHACSLVALSVHTAELTAALGTPTAKSALDILQRAADALCQMGAEAIVPCSSRLQEAAGHLTLGVPLLPIYDALGRALQTLRMRRVGLVGAGSETEEMHWRRRLARYQVVDLFVPVHRDREHLRHLITEELQQGLVNQTTRADVGRIVYSLRQAGARAIVLATPELALALSHLDPVLPVLDAAELHALSALEWSLSPPLPDQSAPARKLTREKRPRNHATTQA